MSPGRSRPARLRWSLRLGLEPLEDRTLLTTMLLVDSLLDDGVGETLRDAIGQANSGSDTEYVIEFSPSVRGEITLTQGELALANTNSAVAGKTIAIAGPGASQLSVSGNHASRVFSIAEGVSVTLAGLTITEGAADIGGGIFNFGTLTLTNSTISGNSADFGGGVLNSGTVTLTNSTLTGNSAIYGGGIYNDGGTVTLTNSTLTGNSAIYGGGIYNYYGGTLTLTNSTLTGNSATFRGVIYNNGGTVTLTNSTLTGNSAEADGGGIYNHSTGTLTLSNTIVAGNQAPSGPDVAGAASSQGHNLIGDVTGSSGWVGTDLTGTAAAPLDPLLGPLQDNGGPTWTMALLASSPAIDAGDDAFAPLLDQRGAQRGPAGLNAGGHADIGAYEASSSYLVTSAADSTAVGTLRAAVGWANRSSNANPANLADPAPNTVRFDTAGLFAQPQTIALTGGELLLSNTATATAIAGPGAAQLSVSGNHASRVFSIAEGVSVTLAGLTITEGRADNGGGISNSGMLMLTNSTLSANSARSVSFRAGGGIYNANSGTLTLTNSTISGNSAISGGGIYNYGTITLINSTLSGNSANLNGGGIVNDGTITLTNSTLSGNSAANGGGIYSTGTITVTNSTLSGNSANAGGGIYNDGTITLTDSTLSGSSATNGGGIYNYGRITLTNSTLSGNFVAGGVGGGIRSSGTVTLINSTLSGNSATSVFGGGIYSTGTITLTNSTLSGNSAGIYGGGIYTSGTLTLTNSTVSGNSANSGGGVYTSGTMTLTNTIVARNQGQVAPDLNGDVFSQGHNLIGDTGGSTGWVDSDLTGTATAPLDPLLGPLQDNGGPTWTMALLPGSPALDAGASVAGLTTDQRGIARPQGSAFDIGAFESRGFVLTVASGGNQSTPVGQSFGQPLVVRVSSPFGEPVEGGVVGFTAPGSGASATPATAGVVISGGTASLPVVANLVAGSYEVTASASGASQPARFSLVNTPGEPFGIIRVSGPGPTATVATAFAEPLIVLVTDAYDNPVPGATVTFAAPSTGAGATFSGSATIAATTDGSGLAAVQVTANTVAGTYAITATSASAGLSLNLTNTPGAPARVAGASGAPQAATVNTAFAEPLVVLVTDEYDNPVPGATVSFAAPGGGASALFGDSATFTATTDAAGRATTQAMANTVAGSYSVVASVAGVTTPAAFALTNTPGAAARITATGGAPQSTTVATAFNQPLLVRVTDQYDNPVPGVSVSFAAPSTGAGASLGGATITDASGLVSMTATANTAAGSYSVTASVVGVTIPTAFALTNTPDAPARVSAIGGTPQSTMVNTAFAQPLRVQVSDQYGNAVPGATVAFVTPGTGPGASFSSETVVTDASGEAAVTATANTAAGRYAVTASLETGTISARAVAGTTVADFALDNTAGVPARITATGGTPQAAAVAAPFAQPLVVLVTDEYGNPAPGVTVTFAVPTAGAGAALAAGVAVTDAAGLASVLAAANAQAGSYAVAASVAGLAPVALFALTNTATIPPTVVGLSRFGFHEQTTRLVLSFDQALDPGPAQNTGNYLLQGPGRDGRLGTRDDVPIALGSAAYDPAARTVTLVPADRLLKLRKRYRLTVKGTAPGGLTSAVGIPLAGSPVGVPGTDYVARFNRGTLSGPSDAIGTSEPSQAGRRRAAEARLAANPLVRRSGVARVVPKLLGWFRARPQGHGGLSRP